MDPKTPCIWVLKCKRAKRHLSNNVSTDLLFRKHHPPCGSFVLFIQKAASQKSRRGISCIMSWRRKVWETETSSFCYKSCRSNHFWWWTLCFMLVDDGFYLFIRLIKGKGCLIKLIFIIIILRNTVWRVIKYELVWSVFCFLHSDTTSLWSM